MGRKEGERVREEEEGGEGEWGGRKEERVREEEEGVGREEGGEGWEGGN